MRFIMFVWRRVLKSSVKPALTRVSSLPGLDDDDGISTPVTLSSTTTVITTDAYT